MKKHDLVKNRIMQVLRQHVQMTIGECSEMLKMSEPNLRRYFIELEAEKKLLRIHGGVRLTMTNSLAEYQFALESTSHIAQKRAIGEYACTLVGPHDRLYLDAGTTISECSQCLANYFKTNPHEDLRIVTNSLTCSVALADYCTIMCTGGRLRPQRMDFSGSVALEVLRHYNFTKAFHGVDGIDDEGNIGTTDEETSALTLEVMRHSEQNYILADSSKLSRRPFVPVVNLREYNCTLITDDGISDAYLKLMKSQGVNVIVVPMTSF